MSNALEELKKAKKEYKAKVKTEGVKAVKQILKEWVEAHPTIEAIRWEQYTPYFNDGDTCVFSVGDISAKMKGAADDAGDSGDGFQDTYDIEETDKKLAKDMESLSKVLSDHEDVLEQAFGDHAQITVTKTKIEVDSYEHD